MTSAAQLTYEGPLEAIEEYFEQGLTDGLPVVPPTVERVREFIDYAGRPAEDTIATMEPVNRVCTVESAAINAVMAGCRPEYFPVVLAVLEACMDPRWGHFHGSTASTGGTAQLIVVNGAVRQQLGMNAGINVFGPGNRANATIGRTMRLILINVFGMAPAVMDMSVQGHPGKYSYCIAENEEESPWPPWHVDQGYRSDESTVTVVAARGVIPVENRGGSQPEEVLGTIADVMANLGTLDGRAQVVVMGPEHAGIVARAGWSKADAQRYLWEHARRPIEDMERVGKRGGGYRRNPDQPAANVVADSQGRRWVHQGEAPEHIMIVVGGGNNGGVSSIIPTWAYPVDPGDWAMATVRDPVQR